MVEMKDWSKRLLTVVGPRGPEPQEYAAVSLAFKYMRHWIPNYKVMVKELIIEPHEKWVREWEYQMDTHSRPFFNVLLHIWHEPRGYAGDGDLLTKLYRMLDTPNENSHGQPINPWVFSRWDAYMASLPETLALQSRTEYVSNMAEFCAEKGASSWLDVACGVGEHAKQVYMEQGDRILRVSGIDNDGQSINVAQHRNSGGFVNFYEGNVLKGMPPGNYDVVYSAGLFDYLSDDMFVRLGKRLLTAEPRHVMIGNIAEKHPSKDMMECLGWTLFDRNAFDMLVLAEAISGEMTWTVDKDRTGLQLYLRGEK